MQDAFEKAFDDFLEQREYDDAGDALFRLVRAAFYAGWQAAGGAPMMQRPSLAILPSAEKIDVDENGKITGLF